MGLPFVREMTLAMTAFTAVGCGSSDSSDLRDQTGGSPAAPSSGGASGGGGVFGSGGVGGGGAGGTSGMPAGGAAGSAGASGSAGQAPTVDAGSTPPDSSFVPMPIPPPAPVGCVTTAAAGVHEFACDTTTHVVSVPEQCMTTACGVI